ncbi:hypothetical protein LOH54_12255 [Sulfurimonas sp. HSL-3221]|uniref:hypothetical protein n=1 Tax=Sulfurimonadaceae TaxID=2771471 RepID=UPI001E51E443|nr:hypothetical protein [Sulfurimonas sp. HSL-3221]UFS62406.1 hypothetical protein LOH54_12255 [Sulfurimonas sp. HSL-3221]
MIDRLGSISEGIAAFIVAWLREREGFECRSFYGEAFALALLQRTSVLDEVTEKKLVSAYEKLDKTDPEFHWEFNDYALLDFWKQSESAEIGSLLEPLRFKNTPCTNWTLLRSNTRLVAGIDSATALKEATEKIEAYQLPSGLILDDPGVKSFQYHCFSMAMIGEISRETGERLFLDSFQKGVAFIRHFILHSGETLYIGRGQNQSFGYGALIYILALAYSFTGDDTLLGDMERVLGYLEQYQRPDGSFPLVLNGQETSIPVVVDMHDPAFSGWYPYNNYFDYLPFLGFFLAKAHAVLQGTELFAPECRTTSEYRDGDFIKVVKPAYEAVLSKTGGYWTNDQPMPYIVRYGRNITPCYGGEQFQESLYGPEGIPLPFCSLLRKSLRWRSVSLFKNDTLWLLSPLGIMKRDFMFDDDGVTVVTKVFSLFSFRHLYLCLDDAGPGGLDTGRLAFEGYEYSASGRLRKYSAKGIKSSVRIEVCP